MFDCLMRKYSTCMIRAATCTQCKHCQHGTRSDLCLQLHPQKPLRIVRQKGKAALGKLKVIEDLPKERCCVDNCVMVSVQTPAFFFFSVFVYNFPVVRGL